MLCCRKNANHGYLSLTALPSKLQRYTISNKFHRDDIVINKNTSITPTTVNFQYKGQDDNLSSIEALPQVAAGQLVLVMGHLEHLSVTKTIILDNKPLNPFTPTSSRLIPLTVCQTLLKMSVLRIFC